MAHYPTMFRLKSDSPNIARVCLAVSVSGAEYHHIIHLQPGQSICTHCEGSGRDAVYDYRCEYCDDGIYTQEEEDQ